MATKGGGLLGGADAQLVQGAFRAEMANTSPNMSGVYAMQAENVGNLQTAIQDIFYATNKSNNDLYNDVKEKSSLILADIESGTFSDDDSIGLYTNAINDLREQAKSIPKGREGESERARIKAQLAKMKADTALGEGVITEIATLLKNDQINVSPSADAMVLFNSILDKKAKREIINGELVYSTTDAQGNTIKINHNELNKKFIKKDYAVEAGALKASNGFSKTGLQGGRYDFVGAANLYESIMTTENGVLHLINKPFGSMKMSFVQALQGGDPKLVGEMIGALNDIGGFDVEGDSRPDKITQANISKLVSTLTNQNDKNFNLATTKRVAAAFYADNDGRAQHKKGFDIFNAKTNKLNNESGEWSFSSGKYLPVLGGNRQMPPSFANAMKISLQKAADGKETSFDFFDTKLTYDPKANDGQGNWYDDNNDYGSTSNLIKNTIKVTDPGFVEISSTSSSQAPIKLEALNIKTSAMLPNGEVYENGLVSSVLKGSDNSVAKNINNIIVSNPKNYKFTEYTGPGGFLKSGDIFKMRNQEIMLLDGDDNAVIDPLTNKPYHFRVNDGSKNKVNDVDSDAIELNKLLQSLNIKLKPSI